jgi:hypothetical protein
MTPGRRGSGGDSRAALAWAVNPDRYGTATTDPLGRDGEGWTVNQQTKLPALRKGWTRDPKTGRAVRAATE